jgi:hypothetical protein
MMFSDGSKIVQDIIVIVGCYSFAETSESEETVIVELTKITKHKYMRLCNLHVLLLLCDWLYEQICPC